MLKYISKSSHLCLKDICSILSLFPIWLSKGCWRLYIAVYSLFSSTTNPITWWFSTNSARKDHVACTLWSWLCMHRL